MRYIIILILFSSCITQKRCNDKYPPLVSDSIITIIKDTVLHDTIYLEPEQLVFHDTIPCPDYHKTITHNHITSTVDIHKGILSVTCKEDSLQKVIDEKVKWIKVLDKRNSVRVETKFIVNWYDIMCRWLSAIFFLFIVGFISAKLK